MFPDAFLEWVVSTYLHLASCGGASVLDLAVKVVWYLRDGWRLQNLGEMIESVWC
jgi:hypothetical protein